MDKHNILRAAIVLCFDILKLDAVVQNYSGFSKYKVNANGV